MTNKTTIKKSNYALLDSDPDTIAKNIKEGNTTIENLNQKANEENQEPENSNNVIVRTRQDNLIHNYFHYFDLYWDAGDVMSSTIIRLPKTDQGNTQYWIKYTGEVDIYIGANVGKEIKQTTNENSSSTSTEYWNMQDMKPLFRGEIGNIKEYTDVLEVHIDSIGKRFKQKIPEEFRQSYINNQNVRDAFQAICEFLGVKYICPPPTVSSEDDALTTESSTTDGTENNVTDITQAEQNMASRASEIASQAGATPSSDTSNQSNPSGNDNIDDPNATNSTTNQSLTTTETESPQNGYGDISFDANGAITHGSVIIETSPNMAETLIALTEHPLQKYMEDMTYVAADIKKLLNGEFFDTVHNITMNYDAITIEPKSASTSEMSTVGSTGATGDTNSENGENQSDNSNGSNSNNGNNNTNSGNTITAIMKNIPQPSARAIAGHRGLQELSVDYIRSLTPAMANTMSKNTKYTTKTRVRLIARAKGQFVI